MKICYITNLYPPYILGGAEIIVEKTAINMAKKGNDVIVITTSPDKEEHIITKDNITIYQINTTKLYPVYQQTNVTGIKKPLWHLFDLYNKKTLKKVINIIKKENIDIIHVNNYKGLSLSIFEVGHELNIPLIFESHDFSLICPRANLIRGNNTLCTKRNIICNNYVYIQRKLLNNNIDLLISPSDFMINKYKENNFFTNTPSIKIPLATEYKGTFHEKKYDIINITYIGSLGKHKGVQTLIEAFKEIENNNIELNIIGKGYDEEEFINMSTNDNRIKFHGFIENKDINEHYKKANIIVIPSICYDNSPMVIYESFSTNTPVIGSNIGGIPELIQNGYNGYLFEADNKNDLKEKINKLINNITLLKQFELNAFNTISDDSMTKRIKKLEQEYIKLMSG